MSSEADAAWEEVKPWAELMAAAGWESGDEEIAPPGDPQPAHVRPRVDGIIKGVDALTLRGDPTTTSPGRRQIGAARRAPPFYGGVLCSVCNEAVGRAGTTVLGFVVHDRARCIQRLMEREEMRSRGLAVEGSTAPPSAKSLATARMRAERSVSSQGEAGEDKPRPDRPMAVGRRSAGTSAVDAAGGGVTPSGLVSQLEQRSASRSCARQRRQW